MATYEKTAISNAEKQRFSVSQVEGMLYAEIATLSGIDPSPKKSPPDFFYVNVRRAVVNHLGEAEREVLRAEEKALAKAFVASNPKFAGKTVEQDKDGNIIIK